MARRIEQVNELLRSELSLLIARDLTLKDCLITISFVQCTANLQHAKINVSVLPDYKAPSVIKTLKKHSGQFSSALRKKIKIRQVPKFYWAIDETEKNAAVIEQAIQKIHQADQSEQIDGEKTID